VDEPTKLDNSICDIAYFYQGSATFEWLENQPLSKIKMLADNASRIIKQQDNVNKIHPRSRR
jgi:hypothetical protein